MDFKIALAGNPNSGKTTLFNALTGLNQFVGNWPGVTVEKKEGRLKADKDVTVVDLPGIYSLSPYTLEEVVARNFLLTEKVDAILNIVDGTNLERNLYLTTQLLELGIPVVVAVNMMDLVTKAGDRISLDKLSSSFGCPFVEISALKGDGVDKAVNAVLKAAASSRAPEVIGFSKDVEDAVLAIEDGLKGNVPAGRLRWYAVKLIEKDAKVLETMNLPDAVSSKVDSIVDGLCKAHDDDGESIITNERYNFIADHIKSAYKKKDKGALSTSDKIDRIVTNRVLALPIFAIVMFIVYYFSVTTVGTWVTDFVNDGLFGDAWSFFGIEVPGIPVLFTMLCEALHLPAWLESLLIDGVVAGVGAVLGFVPQMFVLFLFLAFLEGCGYMARIAFIMDRIFRRFGLSGKSFIPMLIGTGCGVPGVMASRTIESDRDRKMTIMTTTFIPCGAKLPIIALIAGALFDGAWWVAPSAYFIGIFAIVTSGIILKKTRRFSGDVAPFVMELPAYHLPTVGSVLRSMWERGWSFIKKAGTIIFISTIVIWALTYFGFAPDGFRMLSAEEMEYSLLATIGNAFAWIFTPLGWGDWRSAVAAITGLVAKENVVGTFGILYGFAEVAEDGFEMWATLAANMGALAGFSFLVFNLLCAPCFAAMGAIKREMNNTGWFWFAIGYQCLYAYCASLVIYNLGLLFTGTFSIWLLPALAVLAIFIWLLFRKPREGRKMVGAAVA